MSDTERTYDWGFGTRQDLTGWFASIALAHDARRWETMPYLSMTDEAARAEAIERWQNREPLRDYLLRNWPEAEVDRYLGRLAQMQAEATERKQWEATWRGRTIIRYRKVRNETRRRVTAAWQIIRHGQEDDQ